MVLWDSRLVHAGANPMCDRPDPTRWRYVVFVCMTPAVWAKDDDYQQKIKAYNELRLTAHWPSQVSHFSVFDKVNWGWFFFGGGGDFL